jgi:hypothetical protein
MGGIDTAFARQPEDPGPATGNLELVRSIVAPWRRGDFRASDWADPEIGFVLADGPSPGRWSGVAEMWAAFTEVLAPYANYRVIAEDIRELDDGRVLVLHRYGGVARTSGMEIAAIDTRGADVFVLRHGRVVKLTIYWQSAHALADLGFATGAGGTPRPARRARRTQRRRGRAAPGARKLAAVPEGLR